MDGFITGSLLSNHPFTLDDGIRGYRDVSVITEHDAFPDRFQKIRPPVGFGQLRRADVPQRHGRGAQHLDVQHALHRPEPGVSDRLCRGTEVPRSESPAAYEERARRGLLFIFRALLQAAASFPLPGHRLFVHELHAGFTRFAGT